MRLSLMFVAASLVAMTAVSSWAACGPEGRAKNKAECESFFSSLNLTEEQSAKIAEIQANCQANGDSPEACKSAMKEIRSILTAEQLEQFDAKCDSKASKKMKCGGEKKRSCE